MILEQRENDEMVVNLAVAWLDGVRPSPSRSGLMGAVHDACQTPEDRCSVTPE